MTLVDSSGSVLVAALLGWAAIVLARRARERLQITLGRAGGERGGARRAHPRHRRTAHRRDRCARARLLGPAFAVRRVAARGYGERALSAGSVVGVPTTRDRSAAAYNGRMFEIGNSLREARTRKGLDFPELEQGTKIRAKYLRALEDEAFETLPSATYVKGFLRTYADYLGLDGQLYVDEYNVRYGVRRRGARAARPQLLDHAPPARPQAAPRLESRLVWLDAPRDRRRHRARDRRLAVRRQRTPEPAAEHARLPRRRRRRRPGCLIRAVGGNTLLIVRSGSEGGRQVWNGTLTTGSRSASAPASASGSTSARPRTSACG